MPQPETNTWFTAFVILAAMASMAAWVLLIQRRLRGPFLEYQPRRSVPWGPVATLLAIFLVVAAFWHDPEWDPSGFSTTYDLVHRIAMGMLQFLLLTGVFCTVVMAVSGATLRDLGLPEYADELGRDIRIGAMACLAALVPVFCVQTLMIQVVDQPSQHPLIQMVFDNPHPIVLTLSFLTAVVVAPICEEIAFRLLLQGWLEKWEDRHVNPQPVESCSEDQASEVLEEEETGSQGDKETTTLEPPPVTSLTPDPRPLPPALRGLLGLPHGWLPILVSSLLFSLAHVGHGSDPVPLFLLAIILGYTYQRTHHIVPCIVTHMLFNLVTLIALGLTIYAP